ncbi:MAG: murein biosynthesis integral membrane protein MurJ [Kofleriaceae bacterium]|nr:murein biosynthesis integral membrane protein MurJ [Kofleriaceae bacterium]
MSAPRSLGRAAGLISLATMLSRLLGLVREQLFAALLGASALADAFVAAFRIPNLLRDLFAEGALSAAFVPTFKASLARGGPDAAYRLGNRVAGNLLVVVGTIVLMAALFTPNIVGLLAGEFATVEGKVDVTVTLTRIMLPFLVLVSLAAVAMGMLNAQERYAAPALAPAMFNVVSIVVGMGLYVAGVSPRWVAIGWSVGTLLGGAAQLGIQLPPLWRAGWRPSAALDLRLRDPEVRRVAAVMAPAIVGVAAMQVNVFVGTAFAASEPAAVSWLNYAFRFLQLPIGVFGVAIATVSTTRYATAAAAEDRPAMGAHLVEGLRMVAFLCVPATVGLVVLGEPIIRLIYQRGRFFAHDTAATVAALELYAIGLVAYAAVKVVAPAFYALGRARIAVIASVTAVAGNLVWSALLHPHHGYRILAAGTALAALLNFTVLYVLFHRRVAPIPHAALLGYLARVGAAAAVMAAAVWGTDRVVDGWIGHATTLARLTEVGVPVVVGAVVYAATAAALGVAEVRGVVDRVTRRLRRR